MRRLVAVQAQDARAVRMAIRARTAGLVAADVDRALTEDRSVIITWANRGTLHLVCAEDHPWLHALTAPRCLRANARRLQEEGVTPAQAERGVEVVRHALAADGPLTRPVLRERLEAAGVPTAGQALVHVLMLTCLRGLAVRGPVVGREHAYALVADWLPKPRPVDRDRALAELARRYLAGHGPADARDLQRWANITLGDARRALGAIDLVQRPDGLVELPGAPGREAPPAKLLGMWDPLLLGWASRDMILAGHDELITVNGLFRAFALVGGRAVGTWSFRDGAVAIEPFGSLTPAQARALDAEAADVVRFWSQRAPADRVADPPSPWWVDPPPGRR